MKVIAVVQADLEVTPLGTKSRLADALNGVPVLRRTVQRVLRAKNLDAVCVLSPTGQEERCRALLEGTEATVQPFDADPPSWMALVAAGRKWSLDGWRGGVGGTTHFDEFVDGRLIHRVLEKTKAEAVLCVPPAAPLIDPALIDSMIEHHRRTKDASRLTFTQSPPGLAGLVLDAELVQELAESKTPVGWIFSYKPDSPQKDLLFQGCCCEIPEVLRYAVGRLTADTGRSWERLTALLGEDDDPDIETAGRWLMDREASTSETVPSEVEIELTTLDPYPRALLRPCGAQVESRGPIDPAIVERVVAEVICDDTALVILGGFGDPLRHEQFVEILQRIRSVQSDGRTLYGLAVRSSAVDLSDQQIDAMVTYGVDIFDVTLDAWTPELYSQLQSPDRPKDANLEGVTGRLDRLNERRQQEKSVTPILLPSMIKSRQNVHELDDFHDGWIRKAGAVAFRGYSHFGRRREDHSVIDMSPNPRIGCRRIRSRCMVLADGRVAVCDQDFDGSHTVGDLGEQSLEQIWHGDPVEHIRRAHREGCFDPTPLCAACAEWHRP